jgi:uncharacterized protein YejL (UPF0352 family)
MIISLVKIFKNTLKHAPSFDLDTIKIGRPVINILELNVVSSWRKAVSSTGSLFLFTSGQ